MLYGVLVSGAYAATGIVDGLAMRAAAGPTLFFSQENFSIAAVVFRNSVSWLIGPPLAGALVDAETYRGFAIVNLWACLIVGVPIVVCLVGALCR